MKKTIAFTAVVLAGGLALGPDALAQQRDQQKQQPYGQQQRQETYGDQQRQQQPYGQQQRQQTGQTAQQRQQQQYAQHLSAADDLKDMKLQNAQGEDLGSIDKVVVDTQQGKIAYVVVSTGGLWGIGGEKAVVPWNAFQIQQARDQDEQVLVLNVPQDQLRNAPQGDIENVLTQEQARQIHQFYGVSPYWEEGGQKSRQPMMQDRERMQQRQHTPQQQQQQRQPQQRQQSQ